MAKNITDTKIKNLKYSKQKSLSCGDRLSIKVTPSNTKSFKYEYMKAGKRVVIGLGSYPSLSLKEARDIAFKYNQMLANGKDPKIEKAKESLDNENIFSNVAMRAIESKNPSQPYGWSLETYKKSLSMCNRYILPSLKNYNINDVETYQLAKILEQATPSTQEKLKNILNHIFSYGIGKGLCKYNFARDLIPAKKNVKGFSFINPIEDKYNFSRLLNDIDNFNGSYQVKMALKLSALIGFRPQNTVSLRWEDIKQTKIDNKTINYIFLSAERMKMKRDFRQPLSAQAYNLLQEVKQYTGGYEYIFKSPRGKTYITKESCSKALRVNLGYNGNDKPQQHNHGFRKSVRTYISTIASKHNWSYESVRMILSHAKENSIDQIYDKNDYLLERNQMLQLWADYVDEVKESSNIIKLG